MMAVPDDVPLLPDPDAMRSALVALVAPGRTFELRALPSRRSWVGTDIDAAVQWALAAGARDNVYYSLNPLRPDLSGAAKNQDVLCRRLILIDIDPRRAGDDPATDAERGHALSLGTLVQLDTRSRGWPDPFFIDSGNGAQLAYLCDLPNNDHASALVSGVLRKLAEMYDTEHAHVDISVHNAARIARLPGTVNRKGQSSRDRPHRRCVLVSAPEDPQHVPVELLMELAGVKPVAEACPAQTSRWTVPDVPNGDASAWFRKALEHEAGKVATAPAGGRHNTLRAAARTLAGYLHHGHFTEAEVVASLTLAGNRAGLDAKDVADTIGWGLDDGKAKPMPLPDKLKEAQNHRPAAAAAPPGSSITVIASTITPTKVEWLWPNRIPIGKLTTFAGWGGLGKSFVTLDIAARVSVGGEWPHCGGECAEAGNVLIMNTEDDPSDTTVPRLMLAEPGVNLNRVRFLRSEVLGAFTLGDLETLDRAYDEMGGCRLLVIDPATAHLGKINDHRNAELRAVLSPLSLWAMERRVAVVMVSHVNKPQAGKVEALARVVGGVAWVNAVRAAVMFARDPDDPAKRLMVGMKNNLGPEQQGISYRILPLNGLARVEWLDQVETTADEAINSEKKKPRGVVASEWLVNRFRDKREWPSDELFRAAKEAGVSRNAIFEAKNSLNLPACRQVVTENGDKTFVWWVPPDWGPLTTPLTAHCPGPEKRTGQWDSGTL